MNLENLLVLKVRHMQRQSIDWQPEGHFQTSNPFASHSIWGFVVTARAAGLIVERIKKLLKFLIRERIRNEPATINLCFGGRKSGIKHALNESYVLTWWLRWGSSSVCGPGSHRLGARGVQVTGPDPIMIVRVTESHLGGVTA